MLFFTLVGINPEDAAMPGPSRRYCGSGSVEDKLTVPELICKAGLYPTDMRRVPPLVPVNPGHFCPTHFIGGEGSAGIGNRGIAGS